MCYGTPEWFPQRTTGQCPPRFLESRACVRSTQVSGAGAGRPRGATYNPAFGSPGYFHACGGWSSSLQNRALRSTQAGGSTFPNNYSTIGLPPHSHTSFINLSILSIHSLIPSKVTRSHSCSITLRNSSTDRTERSRFCIIPGGAGEEGWDR